MSDPLLNEPIQLAGDDEGGDRARIRAKASALVKAALRTFPDAKPPPFRPEMYTELLGIPVIHSAEIDGWDALLVPTPAGYRILCNDRMPAARRAFTLCHEVGHTFFAGSQERRYFLRTKQRKSCLSRETARLERACDIAAAELVMPQPWFEEAVGRRGLRAAALPELSREFAVSLEAAALRLVETVNRPCAVGFFEFGLPPSAESGLGRRKRALERVRGALPATTAVGNAGLHAVLFSSLGLKTAGRDHKAAAHGTPPLGRYNCRKVLQRALLAVANEVRGACGGR